MKKLLGISLVAVLAVSPLMARAETVPASTTFTSTSTEAGLVEGGTNVVIAAKDAYYAGKSITDNDRAATASAAYVKGAYNDAISAVNKVAKELGDDIQSESGRVDLLSADVDALEGKVGTATLTTTAQTLTEAVNELKSQQYNDTALSGRVTTAEGKITTLENTVNNETTGLATKASQSDLTALSGRVTTAEGKVTTLESTVNNATTGLATKASQSDLTALTTRVTTAEGEIDTLQSNVSGINTTLQNVATKTEVTANINGATGAVTLDSNNGLAVAGNVSGTVPMMVEWGATTAGTAAMSGTISSDAKATGAISGIDITAPTYIEDAQ